MSELSEDEAKNFSAHITKSKQRASIEIETLCGNTVPISHALLKDICGNGTLKDVASFKVMGGGEF